LENELADKRHGVLDSLCKVYTVRCKPNFFMPWQNQPQTEGTGTGFVIDTEKKLILTNAHVVSDQVFVMVKRQGSSTKYRALVQVLPCSTL
jgi:S1-C subfamily serine protease